MNPSISIEQLVGYIAGELTDESKITVEAALRSSPELRQEFAEIQSLIHSLQASAGERPPAALIERAVQLWRDRQPQPASTPTRPSWPALQHARRIVAHLLFDTRQNVALPGFRSHSEMAQLAYVSENATIDLQLNPPTSSNHRDEAWHIRGQIAWPTPEAAEIRTVVLVLHDDAIDQQLSPAGEAGDPICVSSQMGTLDHRVVAEAQPDASGQFAMRAPQGRYSLHVRLNDGASIVVEDLRIG